MRYIPFILLLTLATATQANSAGNSAHKRPNFLVIVADDIGFSDLGFTGSEIRTPNLDELAQEGVFLRHFYVGGTCSPTRAMLLSGVDHHLAGIGNMIEHIAPNQVGRPGYEGYLHERVVALPQILTKAGYQTYATGKWHLGLTEGRSPKARGFDRSFMLLNGGASHFDQRGLNKKTDPAQYREDGELVGLPNDFNYSTDFYTQRMIEYIGDGLDSGKPFFAYLAYTAPHWPLQAPEEDIAKYKGRYDTGWEAIREERLSRMMRLGLIPDTTVLSPIHTSSPEWSVLPAADREIEARKMEVFAAMVDRLDQQVGVIVDYLEQIGERDNTFILFLSDNGAEGAPLYQLPAFSNYMTQFDNSLENIGKQNSYVFYEERWAQVGSTPFRLYKGMASEGGIHVPAFINSPMSKAEGQILELTHVTDIAPTILDLAGIPQPGASWEGNPVLGMQGKSWAPLLLGDSTRVRAPDEGLGSELFNKRSYRQGNWKALHLHEPFGPGRWELFDLSEDPGETNDLSDEYPDTLAALIAGWEAYAEQNGVILGDAPPDR